MIATAATLGWDLIPLASGASASAPLAHERPLVALSMAAAVLGSYAALEFGSRTRAHVGVASYLWLALSGFAMAAGVFSMHLIGLAALETPLMRGFSPGLTTLSGVVALTFAVTGYMIGGPRFQPVRYVFAGFWFGLGGILMHYLGMAGLIIDAALAYNPLFVMGTTAGGFLCSTASLWLCTNGRPRWMQAAMAFPMGAAVAALHFFDMAGAVLTPQPQFSPLRQDIMDIAVGAAIAMAVLAVLSFLLTRWDETRRPRAAPAASTQGWAGLSDAAADEEGVVIVPEGPPRGERRG